MTKTITPSKGVQAKPKSDSTLYVVEGVAKTMEETKGDLSDTAKSIGDALINEVQVETTVSKSSVKPFASNDKKGPNLIEKILRPKITVKGKDGNVIYVSAPYGEPADISGFVKAGVLVTVLGSLGAIFGAGRLSKGKRK